MNIATDGDDEKWIQGACLPIVYVPVHIVMGMPMTVGMGMPMAITMGTKKHIIGIAHGYSHGHAHYILAVPMTFSMGTKEIHNFVNWYYTSRMEFTTIWTTIENNSFQISKLLKIY